MDEVVDSANNLFYWPGYTSKIFWGDFGATNLAGVKGGSTHGLPEETDSVEEDPDLEDEDNNDYRIESSTSGVYGAGYNMGSGDITELTIQEVAYPIPWDFALGSQTVWGTGATLPVIEELSRDEVGWDIGAYAIGWFISNASPTDNLTDAQTTLSLSWANPDNYSGATVYFKADSGECSFVDGDRVKIDQMITTVSNADLGGPLAVSTDYCWRVDVHYNADADTQEGGVMNFTTAEGETIPVTINPNDGVVFGGRLNFKAGSGGVPIVFP